jgi:MFS family permease
MASPATAPYREVRDRFGRVYRIGETPEQLTGHGRWVYILVPWIAMMLISTFEYAWGTAEGTVGQVYGWNLTHLATLFSVWVVFEAGSSAPTGWLRERGYLSVRSAVLIGGIAVAVAYWSMTIAANPWVAFIGWTVIGGTGAGMIYSSCINTSSKWYPENKGLRTGFINGGFAYGSVPFIFLLGAYFHPSNFRAFLLILGLCFGLAIVVCSFFFRDPPKNWWPAHVDPVKYREDAERRRELNVHKNPPAVRQWTLSQSLRTRQIYLLWLNMFVILAAGLFGIAWTVPVAQDAGWAGFAAAGAGAIFAFLDGVGRPISGWLSEYLGRRGAMRWVFGVMAVFLLLNYWGAMAHIFALYVIASGVVGMCTGMQFPLFAVITADYYGETTNAQNYGIVYSAKVPGGLAGGLLGSVVISAWGYDVGFLLSAGLAALAVLLTWTHHQPTLDQYRQVVAGETEIPVAGATQQPAAGGAAGG